MGLWRMKIFKKQVHLPGYRRSEFILAEFFCKFASFLLVILLYKLLCGLVLPGLF